MSLMKTKPIWHRGECVATERGWVNPQNNEVLVAIGNLKAKLEAEGVSFDEPEKKVRKPYVKKPKLVDQSTLQAPTENDEKEPEMIIAETVEVKTATVIAEVVENDPTKQVIAEVVENDPTKKVIAE